MPTLPRAADLVTIFLEELQSKLGQKVDTREGSRWDALLGAIAQGFVRSNSIVSAQFDAHVLDRAENSELDNYCTPRGPVRRHPAASSRGSVTFTRSVYTAGAGTITAGTEIRAPYKGKSYIFTVRSDKTVSATTLTLDVEIDAQTAGSDSNVGSVTGGVTLTGNPAVLWDTTLLPTTLFVSGGSPIESDDELRQRQRLWEQSRQRATEPAIAYGALTVNGVKHVVLAKRFDNHLGGGAAIYAGDRDWKSTTDMLNAVALALESWRGLGPSVSVNAMQASDVTVSATIEMARSVAAYDLTKVRADATAKAVAYFENRKDPYAYNLASLSGYIERAHDEITSVVLSAPVVGVASPLSPSALALSGAFPTTLTRYRTNPSLVSFTIVGPS